MTTSWMWKAEDGGVWGLSLDLERGIVEWADSLGCACSGSFAEQRFADFLEIGPRYGQPPQHVLDEVQTTIRALLAES